MQIESLRVKSYWTPTNTTTATTARTAAKNKTSAPRWRIINTSKRPPDCLKCIEPVHHLFMPIFCAIFPASRVGGLLPVRILFLFKHFTPRKFR